MVVEMAVALAVTTTVDMEDVEGAEESQAVHLIHHLVHRHHLIQSPILQVHTLRKVIEKKKNLHQTRVDNEASHLLRIVAHLVILHLPLLHPLLPLVHHLLVHLHRFLGIPFAIITEEFQFIQQDLLALQVRQERMVQMEQLVLQERRALME